MKVKVTLFVAGKVFDEIVYSANYDDAKKTALSRNPTATIVSVTATFLQNILHILENKRY